MENERRKLVGQVLAIVVAASMVIPAAAFLLATHTFAASEELIVEAPPASSRMIRLQRAAFDTRNGEPNLPTNMRVSAYPSTWYQPYIVQSDGPITEEWKDAISQTGAQIVSYIPDNAVLVRVPTPNIEKMRGVSGVCWAGVYQPAYKVQPKLDSATGTTTLEINFFIEGTNGPAVRFLKEHGAEFLGAAHSDKVNKLIVKTDASLISALANFPDVKWIREFAQPVKLNNPSTQLLQSGSTTGGRVIADDPTDAIPGRQINGDLKNDGAGFGDGDRKVACVCDSGIRTTHEVWSEAGKIIDNYVPDGSQGELGIVGDGEHGQATAGMVCGDAPVAVDYTISGDGKDGAAFAARLVFQDIGKNVADPYVYPPIDYYHDMFQDAQYGDPINNHIGGASVHSNSWGGGSDPSSGYGDDSVQIDQYVWDNKDFLITFSAGNGGADNIGAPQEIDDQAESKNCIGVGSTTEAGTLISSFSSWGPSVPDGRIKPDLVAVGEGITTADSGTDTDYTLDDFAGTSASNPGLAGHGVLVQQYFEDGWYPTGAQVFANGFTPSAALVKATLINGAVPIGTIPNMQEGWGRIHLENSLYFAGDTRQVRYIDHGGEMPGMTPGVGLFTGDYIEYVFGVSDGAQPLRISMVYSDYPGDPAASVMLVNDLDLLITDPGATQYRGNNFVSGWSVNTGVSNNDDNLNNIECVYIQTPPIGAYTIRIDAESIPKGPQDFALVVSGGLSAGYGIVFMDRMVYTVPDTINLKVEDPNNAAASLTVTLTSSGSGDSEVVTLPATGVSTGVFTGSIATAFDIVTSGDGVLQVNEGDTVLATYSDANPIHDSTARATIQTWGPVITNVRVEAILGTAATVRWDTNIPSNSTVYYGTVSDSSLWTNVKGDQLYTTSHSLILTGLTMETLYYFDVASSTTRGVTTRDDFGGSHYTFTTVGLSTGALVLYVDDDDGTVASDGTPFDVDWGNNLDAYGWTYTRWDVSLYGTPTQADMEQCKMVMWVVDEGYPQIGASDRAVLQQYLSTSPNPKLYVVGQDIGWDMNPGGTDVDQVWYEQWLHAIFEADDASGGTDNVAPYVEGDINVMGFLGDPITDGYQVGGTPGQQYLDVTVFNPDGPGATVNYPRFWPDDITNNGGTRTWDYYPAAYVNHTGLGNAAAVRADEAQSTAHAGYPYRMVYEAFTHEMMGLWNPPVVNPIRSDVMDKSCIWLLGADHPEVTLTYPVGGETLSGTVTITWTPVGSLNTKVFYSPNNGSAWYLIYEDLTGAATSYNWDTTTLNDGTQYEIKVLVTGTLDLTDFDTSGPFTLANNVDNLGPAVVAGSAAIAPQPTYTPATATLNATITDAGRGNSNITAAQYYIDWGTLYQEGPYAMNPADGLWNSMVESVTASGIPSTRANGTHTIHVQGKDAKNNWGELSMCLWYVVNSDPAPVVSILTPAPTTQDQIISGSYAITWSATDNDPAATLDVSVFYSSDGGSTWNVLESGTDNNDGTYTWNTATVADGVNYKVKIEVTDSLPQKTIVASYEPFSVDNIVNDRWYFQASPPSNLTMHPVQLTANEITVPIVSAGEFSLGMWESAPMASDMSIAGLWNFSAWGKIDIAGLSNGRMKAKIYKSSDLVTPLYTTVLDDGDVGANTTYTQYSWSDAGVTGFVPIGERAVVELVVDATAGAPTVTTFDNTNADIPVEGTVTGTHTNTQTSDNIYEAIQEIGGAHRYNYVGVTAAGGPHDAYFCDVDVASTAEFDTPNSRTELTDLQYTQVAYSDDTRAASLDPGVGDETLFECRMAITEDPATIVQIDLLVEGQSALASNYQIYARNMATNAWDAIGAVEPGGAAVDVNFTRSITTNPGNYISAGILRWGCYQTVSSEILRVDYADAVIHTPQRLEHKWTISVTGGDSVTFNVEAYHTANADGDDFTFAYSTNNVTYTDMLTVTKTADDNTLQTYTLPSTLSGVVYIRVNDNDRTITTGTLDTIYIDRMYILSTTFGPSFTFGYDYGATQSYVEPALSAGALPSFLIDVSGASDGWIMISTPLVPGDTSLPTALTDLDGNTTWDRVLWYDAQAPAGAKWKQYYTGWNSSLNDLTNVDHTMGVWIHILNPGDGFIRVQGTDPVSTNISLYAGWNLIGYPATDDSTYTVGDLKTNTSATYVEGFAATTYKTAVLLDTYVLKKGECYWVYVPADTFWLVDW
ncbi:MAG: S8 family serine peptidase [Candidatus Thermoplasmatota archaeon]